MSYVDKTVPGRQDDLLVLAIKDRIRANANPTESIARRNLLRAFSPRHQTICLMFCSKIFETLRPRDFIIDSNSFR